MKTALLVSAFVACATVPRPAPAGATFDAGDLEEWEQVAVEIDGTELILALADEQQERSRGLMGVTDFGDFDGMLFAWGEEVSTGIHMKDTLVPLDISFFDSAGTLVDRTTLQPCLADPCEVFVADGTFQWALESPAGALRLEDASRLAIP